MRKARAAAAPKPKPKARPRAAPKPKGTPSPASLLSGGSSPSAAGTPPSPAADLSFLSPSLSPEKPRTRGSPSPIASPAAASPLAAPAALSTIGDLRSLAASHLDSLKRRIDAIHGDSVRDLEASHSRLSKRVKMQTHGCVQLAEEADKEHRKVADKIAERAEVVKNSYKKFVAEVQASTSLCKVTVTEMAKSAERAIDGLRSRYNISATLA
ncbi:hypothetical protein PVAP13_6KG083000 [Panicum virgatum]|uniref:Uncharacterized protein n=1 Tax=Panicum virgatum TaxID=38727 RepID=A0A8T0R892_PANVG|nr:hypothetical protein PVAP13_6KG083000 [Panicum virgatum]